MHSKPHRDGIILFIHITRTVFIPRSVSPRCIIETYWLLCKRQSLRRSKVSCFYAVMCMHTCTWDTETETKRQELFLMGSGVHLQRLKVGKCQGLPDTKEVLITATKALFPPEIRRATLGKWLNDSIPLISHPNTKDNNISDSFYSKGIRRNYGNVITSYSFHIACISLNH